MTVDPYGRERPRWGFVVSNGGFAIAVTERPVMQLKCREVVHYVVDYHDFDAWVKAEFGQPYEVVAELEARNDSEHEMSATGKAPSEWDRKELAEFVKSGVIVGQYTRYKPHPSIFLEDAAFRGILPAGSYLIRVSW